MRRIMFFAENECHQFFENGGLEMKKRRICLISRQCVTQCLPYIFFRHHRQLIDCGSKRIRTQDGDSLLFSKIRRTRGYKEIAREYVEWKKRPAPIYECIGKLYLMYVLSLLTSSQQSIIQCVNYCLWVLVFENVRNLKKVVKERMDDVEEREKMGSQLDAVSDFLKHG